MGKTLNDYPAFASADQTLKKVGAELNRVRTRRGEVEQALLAIQTNKQPPSALAAFQAESNPMPVDREGLRREFAELEQREQFLEKAAAEAAKKLERERSIASFEFCREARPAFVEQIRKQLQGLELIRAANVQIARLRDELEQQGVRTGSIPVCVIPEVGNGSEAQFDLAVRYRHWIRENFPELN